ncbi:MAG: Spy/CpxP family protein refolding chaperone [Gammaproteobacteria bacterium]
MSDESRQSSEQSGEATAGECGGGMDTCPGRRRGRRVRIAAVSVLLIGVGALGGALAATAGSAFAHGGWRHGGGFGEAFIADRAAGKLDRMMDIVDATPEQKAQAEPIVEDLVAEVLPLVEQHREHRRALMATLAGGRVDRDEIEVIRTAEIALIDHATSAVADAAAELSSLLTPEQREKVVRIMASRHRHGAHHDHRDD